MDLPVGATAAPAERDSIAEGITAAGDRTASEPVATADGDQHVEGGTIEGTRFAHASEAEMARILDFYAVRWEYEPTTFPILWNLDGDVVESFAPDFYLPDIEVFLEMTTLKQRLVRKKNRKLRRLRELYPGIRIKLFYARDFRAMMLKYGRLGLAQSLSGTLGQVASERAPVVPPIAAIEIDDDPETAVRDAVESAADVNGDVTVGVDSTASGDDAPAEAVTATDPAAAVESVDAGQAPVPAGARAMPRTRPGRRRRRPRRPMESGAEQEAGT